MLAENASSGFAGSLVDFQTNGVSLFKIDSAGNTTINYANLNVNEVASPTAAPTLSVTNSGGTLAAGTWFGKYTWYNSNGETLASPESTQATTTGGASQITFTIASIPTGATGAKLYLTPVNGASGTEVYQNVTITSGTTGVVTAYNAGSSPNCCVNATGGYVNATKLVITDDGTSFSGISLTTSATATTAPHLAFSVFGHTPRSIFSDSSDNIDINNTSAVITDKFDNNGYITVTGQSTTGTLLTLNAASGFTGNLIDYQVNGSSRFSIDSNGHISLGGSTPTVAAASGDGTSPPAPSVGGTDVAGEIFFGAGTGGITANNPVVTLTFAHSYASTPKAILLTWATAGVGGGTLWVQSLSSTQFSFAMNGTLSAAAAGSYAIFYWVVQ